MRVQVAIDRYYYPDATVSCDENEIENALNSPRVVFEVLSPITEAIDRTEKLEAYKAQRGGLCSGGNRLPGCCLLVNAYICASLAQNLQLSHFLYVSAIIWTGALT
jgi:hypothetical protein